MTTSQELHTLFPTADAIPAAHDFAPGGGTYADGTQYLVDGEVRRWTGPSEEVLSPICIRDGDKLTRRVMGRGAQLSKDEALVALAAANRAYDRGRGAWPTMRVQERMERVVSFVDAMRRQRETVVRLLMWEIGKTLPDCEKEFDRTIEYISDTVEALKQTERDASSFSRHQGILAQIRRAPLGPTLCMGPFNYPLNETFTTLIPALIMGNTVVTKGSRFGLLCVLPLLKAFADCFPKGVVNVINGSGSQVCGPLMETGDLSVLAFIGSSRVANLLKKQHPRPNRLRCVLGLDAKNPAIVLKDADIALAVKELVNGTLTFNGQRCTAVKLIHVHRSVADRFVREYSDAVDALKVGMPWEPGARITPLPEMEKPVLMGRLVEDAMAKGAHVTNPRGGHTAGTLYAPSVVYPVLPDMRLFREEQFGPVVPITVFDDVAQVADHVAESNYGQQVSVFSNNAAAVGPLVDFLVNQVSRVNINAQCQRGPDVFPFTGRKDSAEGTLSVTDALRSFSIRAMVASPDAAHNRDLLRDVLMQRTSNFINTDYLF